MDKNCQKRLFEGGKAKRGTFRFKPGRSALETANAGKGGAYSCFFSSSVIKASSSSASSGLSMMTCLAASRP